MMLKEISGPLPLFSPRHISCLFIFKEGTERRDNQESCVAIQPIAFLGLKIGYLVANRALADYS